MLSVILFTGSVIGISLYVIWNMESLADKSEGNLFNVSNVQEIKDNIYIIHVYIKT